MATGLAAPPVQMRDFCIATCNTCNQRVQTRKDASTYARLLDGTNHRQYQNTGGAAARAAAADGRPAPWRRPPPRRLCQTSVRVHDVIGGSQLDAGDRPPPARPRRCCRRASYKSLAPRCWTSSAPPLRPRAGHRLFARTRGVATCCAYRVARPGLAQRRVAPPSLTVPRRTAPAAAGNSVEQRGRAAPRVHVCVWGGAVIAACGTTPHAPSPPLRRCWRPANLGRRPLALAAPRLRCPCLRRRPAWTAAAWRLASKDGE